MGRLDDELSEAVKEAETVAAVAPAVPSVDAGPKRNVGFLIGLLAVGSGLMLLTLTAFDGSGSWSRNVDEFVSEKDRLSGRNVRVTGMLVKGSLRKRDQPCEYRFQLTKKGAELPVRYSSCVVPDNFRDLPNRDVVVIVQGKLDPAGHFQASMITAQCPSKYDAEQLAQLGSVRQDPNSSSSSGSN